MEKEISSGTMLGIVLIALAVIIGLGFGIFSIAKGTANEGITKVQTNLANVSASEFQDYDQTVVTGTQVKSAYQNFEGKNVAVLICTTATLDAGDDSGNAPTLSNLDTGAGIDKVYGDSGVSRYAVAAKNVGEDENVSSATGIFKAMGSKEVDGGQGVGFINYNAILQACETDPAYDTTGEQAGNLAFKDGQFYTDTTFRTKGDGTTVLFNSNVANMSKSGMLEYLSPTSKYNSYVVKDATGSYIGVAFVQIAQ